jgi:hypothetical protein
LGLRLTLDVFSGHANPQVVVVGALERDLLTRVVPGRALGPHEMNDAPLSVLGYRGLTIEQLGRPLLGLPKSFRIANGDLIGEGLRHRAVDEQFEDYVCGTTGPFQALGRGPRFFDRMLKEIERYAELRERWRDKRHPWPAREIARCAPPYEPAWWNEPTRVSTNNSYNYAANYRSDNYAQPGLASGVIHNSTCPQLVAAAVADGFVDSAGANNKSPEEGHLVALVVSAGWDYHWYRKGRNGYWTHKPGGGPITYVDNRGELITDPRTAARGGYTQFCTFMVVKHGHIKLSGSQVG